MTDAAPIPAGAEMTRAETARRGTAGTRTTSLLVGALVVAALVLAAVVVPGGAVSAQDPGRGTTLGNASGTCGERSLGLTGDLELDLHDGDVQLHRYEVRGGDQVLALGTATVPATATVTTTVAFSDDVYFGPSWLTTFPFTYEMTTLLRDATGAELHTRVLTAVCAEPGADAVITQSTLDPPTPTTPTTDVAPGRPGGAPLTPRFTG